MHIIKKHKLLIRITILLLILLVVGWLIVRSNLSRPASSEMLGLREVEAYLALPPPDKREEQDLGDYRDPKGVHHYTRSITLQYKAVADIRPTLDTLPGKGWVLLVSDTDHTLFVNQERPSCISVLMHPKDNTSYPLKANLTLMAPTDDACEVFISR
jgi:hypothetical protein